jgi:8-oxo-dGTP diphosphatase
MPHIHTKSGQHDHTASAYIIRLDQPEPVLVLHRHKILGKYLQFGGHIELSENPWQTIAHELLEEGGYELKNLKILQPKNALKKLSVAVLHPQPVYNLTHQFSKTHFHTDIGYALTATGPSSQLPGQGESTDIINVTKAELAALPNTETFENIREVGLFIFTTVLKDWEPVDTDQFRL